jgi:hypothetical protein
MAAEGDHHRRRRHAAHHGRRGGEGAQRGLRGGHRDHGDGVARQPGATPKVKAAAE